MLPASQKNTPFRASGITPARQKVSPGTSAAMSDAQMVARLIARRIYRVRAFPMGTSASWHADPQETETARRNG